MICRLREKKQTIWNTANTYVADAEERWRSSEGEKEKPGSTTGLDLLFPLPPTLLARSGVGVL